MRQRYLGPGKVIHEFGVSRKHKLEAVDHPFDQLFHVLDPNKPLMLKTILHGTRPSEKSDWLVVARPVMQYYENEYFGKLGLSWDTSRQGVLKLAHKWVRYSSSTILVSENIIDISEDIPRISNALPSVREYAIGADERKIAVAGLMLVIAQPLKGANRSPKPY